MVRISEREYESIMGLMGGYSTTTEPTHSHYCDYCGGIWKHTDSECEGPVFNGYHVNSFGCPLCVERV